MVARVSIEDEDTMRIGLPKPAIYVPSEPVWMTYAKGKIGVHELAGAQDNAYIVQILRKCGLSDQHDETPWCSAFVNDCMDAAKIAGTHKANALSWRTWGDAIVAPRYGCIVVLSRPPDPSHGHVALYVGETPTMLVLLGGNQHNQVCITDYDRSRWLGYRWPSGGAGDGA